MQEARDLRWQDKAPDAGSGRSARCALVAGRRGSTVPLGHPSGRGGQIIKAPHTFEANTYGREAAGDWLRAEELRLNAEGALWRTLADRRLAARSQGEGAAVAGVHHTGLPDLAGQVPPADVRRDAAEHDHRGRRRAVVRRTPPRQGEDRARVLRAGRGDHEVCDCRGRRAPGRRKPVHHRRRRHHRQTVGQTNRGDRGHRPRSDPRHDPRRVAAMVALALGCGLRFGEIVALRRSDLDLRAKPPVVRVRRAVSTGPGGRRYEKGPK